MPGYNCLAEFSCSMDTIMMSDTTALADCAQDEGRGGQG